MKKNSFNRRQILQMSAALLAAGCSQKEPLAKSAADSTDDSHSALQKLTIPQLWQRIEGWLSANAPKIIGNLNPPATDAEIAAAEAALGCQMPDQWRQLYQVHNGMNSEGNLGSLFYGMEFWSLAEVVREHGNSQDFAAMPYRVEAADPGIRLENMYCKEWIALSFDGEETLLRIDLDPGPGGNMGQIIFTDHEYNIVILVAKSVQDLLVTFLTDLKTGRYFVKKDDPNDPNQFLECVREIDLANWYKSPRWQHLQKK